MNRNNPRNWIHSILDSAQELLSDLNAIHPDEDISDVNDELRDAYTHLTRAARYARSIILEED